MANHALVSNFRKLVMRCWVPVLVAVLPGSRSFEAFAIPGEGAPLTLTRGTVYTVSNLSELKATVDTANLAGAPATILLANGTDTLDITMLHLTCPDLVIRSASENRNAVVIRGPDEGPNASSLNIFVLDTCSVFTHSVLWRLGFDWRWGPP